MDSFSKRMGIQPLELPFQSETMDTSLRTRLWNVISVYIWQEDCKDGYLYEYSDYKTFFNLIWIHFFNLRIDQIPQYTDKIVEEISAFFFNKPWNEIYDFIEFIVCQSEYIQGLDKAKFFSTINDVLQLENSAYRILNGKICPITNENELNEIKTAISDNGSAVKEHLMRSVELLSDKTSPDFRNSIKESISAVEALAREITGNKKATLEDALKKMNNHKNFHSAFSQALSKLYAYTSDESGIRHSLLDESNLNLADARFMLITCSAFVNYLSDLRT